MSWRALQLRMLIRNDEARIEHLTGWARSLERGDLIPSDLGERIQYAHDALMIHRALLAKLSPTVSSLVNVAPSSDAMQSGSSINPDTVAASAQPGVCPVVITPGK